MGRADYKQNSFQPKNLAHMIRQTWLAQFFFPKKSTLVLFLLPISRVNAMSFDS